ncbi:unnamed protein product [Clonostachys rosea f. rosea IK726]|uniref:Uncharacterized protein n=1 Tax=Clonostachys rosea f. rosea IK726 TaxID=1349383 RepID=A0ACA9THT3_BIOOC|nr:unnamed protein product [Clonostachys rosea f. rosea IK726]
MVKMKGDVQVPEPGRSGNSPSRPARFHMILDEILFNLFGSHLYVRHNKCFYQWSRSPKKQLSTSATRQRQMKSKAFELADQAGPQAQSLVAVAGMRACLELRQGSLVQRRAELVIHHRLPPSWSDYS